MTVLIKLTTLGVDTGPTFNLYSSPDGITFTILVSGVAKAALLAGYTSTTVPTGTTIIRVTSIGTCTNYQNLIITGSTTTTTTSSSSTTTTTTTVVPTITFIGARTCSFTTAGGGGSSCMGNGTFTITGGNYNVQTYASINTGATPLTTLTTNATITKSPSTYNPIATTTSQYVAAYSANILLGPGTYTYAYSVIGSGGTDTGGSGGILYALVP